MKQSLRRLNAMLEEYIDQVSDREKWFYRRYEREIDARRMWEDNMQEVAAQQDELELELQRTAEKGSRRKRELREYRLNMLSSPAGGESLSSNVNDIGTPPHSSSIKQPSLLPVQANSPGILPSPHLRPVGVSGERMESSEDEDDEFFEAIDTGSLPMMVVEPPIATPTKIPWPEDIKIKNLDDHIAMYDSYKYLRTELPISVDNRPSVSLWGILKNSIGKDLTKITFPVSFVSQVDSSHWVHLMCRKE